MIRFRAFRWLVTDGFRVMLFYSVLGDGTMLIAETCSGLELWDVL